MMVSTQAIISKLLLLQFSLCLSHHICLHWISCAFEHQVFSLFWPFCNSSQIALVFTTLNNLIQWERLDASLFVFSLQLHIKSLGSNIGLHGYTSSTVKTDIYVCVLYITQSMNITIFPLILWNVLFLKNLKVFCLKASTNPNKLY